MRTMQIMFEKKCENPTCMNKIPNIRRGNREKRFCCVNCMNQAWRNNNPERYRETVRNWLSKNPDKHNQYCKTYHAKNKDAKRKLNQSWYIKNMEKVTELGEESFHDFYHCKCSFCKVDRNLYQRLKTIAFPDRFKEQMQKQKARYVKSLRNWVQ